MASLFERHTDIIINDCQYIEYGHKINLSTDKSGLMTAMTVEDGGPKDTARFIPPHEQHQSRYGYILDTTIADGSYASQENTDKGKAMGITRAALGKMNGLTLSAMGLQEKTLQKLKNFRADIEANISELKRAFGAGKALWKGEAGFMPYVWP